MLNLMELDQINSRGSPWSDSEIQVGEQKSEYTRIRSPWMYRCWGSEYYFNDNFLLEKYKPKGQPNQAIKQNLTL